MNNTENPALHACVPWHKESFDRFISESLPQLIENRLPLAGYSVKSLDAYTCSVSITIDNVEVDYRILQPDESGLFNVDGGLMVVVPIASSEHLDTAEIKCVGEQLYDYISARLGEAASDLPWDEALVRAWLPLDMWVRNIVTSADPDTYNPWPAEPEKLTKWRKNPLLETGQYLDRSNKLAEMTHLRRVIIPEIDSVVTSGQFGRVCPFETPEGPNIGHIFSIATGATIANSRIEIIDNKPTATLGVSASMVPFLEHNDVNRQLMGVNMMRQWITPSEPEAAIVQTGLEPNLPGIWGGKNLLTAFISCGKETFENSILMSESCAKRFREIPVMVGDKLSNRHGSKGVVSRVLPDDEMPHLPDGTPIELAYSFIGLHTRQNYGQIREALMSRIARVEGTPAVVSPFSAPSETELKERMQKARLSQDGMEVLTWGKNGKEMGQPSMFGWVYWGLTTHLASYKIFSCTYGSRHLRRLPDMQGMLEYYTLRDLGCFETFIETFNTRSNDREDKEEFVKQVEHGPVNQAEMPTPAMLRLKRKLDAAGIRVDIDKNGLSFTFASPSGKTLKLAQAVPHPWQPEYLLSEVGEFEGSPEYMRLVEANEKLERALSGNAPESLVKKASANLQVALENLLDMQITSDSVQFRNNVMFSGRTVLAPGIDLRSDQIGLADEMAWTIFGPLLVRELGNKEEVEKRSDKAADVLDKIMARSWMILTRAPAVIPTSLMAFHPVRIPEQVIRIHPLICYLLNADFDGDQAAVLLPITEAGQQEVGEKLSLAGHLKRDPNLYDLKLLTQETVWGLTVLSRTKEGLDKISEIAGTTVAAPSGFVDRDTLADAMQRVMQQDGVDAVISALEKLTDLGMQVARETGASLNPFIGDSLDRPEIPADDDPDHWNEYMEEIKDLLQSNTDYSSHDFGPQLLAVKSGARGTFDQLLRLICPIGIVRDADNNTICIRHSLREGLTPNEMFARIATAREGLAQLAAEISRSGYNALAAKGPKGFGVLARAMRATHPGKVFARAAASSEYDPLVDVDSRLFVGLMPKS